MIKSVQQIIFILFLSIIVSKASLALDKEIQDLRIILIPTKLNLTR